MGSCIRERKANPENVIVKTESRMKLIYNDTLMNLIYEEYDYLIEVDNFFIIESANKLVGNIP